MRSGAAARGHRAPGLFPGIYWLISVFKHIANLPAHTFPKVVKKVSSQDEVYDCITRPVVTSSSQYNAEQ